MPMCVLERLPLGLSPAYGFTALKYYHLMQMNHSAIGRVIHRNHVRRRDLWSLTTTSDYTLSSC